MNAQRELFMSLLNHVEASQRQEPSSSGRRWDKKPGWNWFKREEEERKEGRKEGRKEEQNNAICSNRDGTRDSY